NDMPVGAERENALSFAARSLDFIVPRPSVLRAIVSSCTDFYVDNPSARLRRREAAVRPLADLLGATPENLPLAARYLREHLTKRLTTDPDDERALSTCILLPQLLWRGSQSALASRPNSPYWQGQAEENARSVFVEIIDVKRFSYPWLGDYLVSHDLLSIDEFLANFGVPGLYNFDTAGDLILAPLAYQIVHAYHRVAMTEKEQSKVPANVPSWAAAKNIAMLVRVLLDAQRPWALSKGSGSLRSVGLTIDHFVVPDITDPNLISALVLLALPFLESAVYLGQLDAGTRRSVGGSGPNRSAAPTKASVRRERSKVLARYLGVGRNAPGQSGSGLDLALKRLSSPTRHVLLGWLAGTISVAQK